MRMEAKTFVGAGDRRIVGYRTAASGGPPRAIVVIAHGFGEHYGRYDHVAAALADRGCEVHGLDHHGHGASEGERGQVRIADAVGDLDQLVTAAAAAYPRAPCVLLGHSLGGVIAFRYAVAHQDRLAGLILCAPAAQIEPDPERRRERTELARRDPAAESPPLDIRSLSRDPAVIEAYERDPLCFHGGIPALTAAEMIGHGETLRRDAPRVRLPTLLMYGSEDPYAGPDAAVFAEALGAGDLTVTKWPGLRHEILNEPERDAVLETVGEWIEAR